MSVRLHRIAPSLTPWQAVQQTWDVCLVYSGAAAWRYRGRQQVTEAGVVRLKEPGERFVTERVVAPAGYLILQVEPEQFAGLARRTPAARQHLTCAQVSGPLALAAARWLHGAVAAGSQLERDEWTLPLIERLLLAHVEASPRPERCVASPGLRRAREFLAARFHEEVPLCQLASIADMHEVSLVRAFRRAYGRPPHQLQIELRVASARRLLAAGVGGAEAATQVGFHDQSHLTRHFKRIVGVSPGRYASTVVGLPRPRGPLARGVGLTLAAAP